MEKISRNELRNLAKKAVARQDGELTKLCRKF